MKIIHCADIHLGLERGPIDKITKMPSRVVDFLESFDMMLDFAIEEQVDAILIAGDIFHTSSPSPMLLNAFASRVNRISKFCPVVILVGNHDTPGPLHRKTSVAVFGELNVDNVYLGDCYDTELIETVSGPLQVTMFPYPTRHIVGDGEIVSKDEYPSKVTEKLSEVRDGIDPTVPAVFLGHFTVSGSIYGSERPMIMGDEAEVDVLDLIGWTPGDGPIDCAWDYIALGHIHHHQEVFDEPPIVYSGSIDRVDFGEEHDDKGFVLVTIETVNTKTPQFDVSWEFISVDPRPLVTLVIDTTGKKRIRNYVLNEITKAELTGAIVRAEIKVDNMHSISSNWVTESLYDAGAQWVRAVKLVLPVEVTTRLDLDKPLIEHTAFELLENYLDTPDRTDDEFNDLMDLAEDIMTGDG